MDMAQIVRERFLLIERLDGYAIWLALAGLLFCLLAYCLKERKALGFCFNALAYLAGIAIAGYFYWRFFLAWEGIYY